MFDAKYFNTLKRKMSGTRSVDVAYKCMGFAIGPDSRDELSRGPGAVLYAVQWAVDTGRWDGSLVRWIRDARGAQLRDMFEHVCRKCEVSGNHSMDSYKDAVFAYIASRTLAR